MRTAVRPGRMVVAGVVMLGMAGGPAVLAAAPPAAGALRPAGAVSRSWSVQDSIVNKTGRVQRLVGIACPSPSECVAVGAQNLTLSLPVLMVTTDAGAAWTSEPVPNNTGGLTAVSCPSTSDCTVLAGVGILVTTDGGTSWTTLPTPSNAKASLDSISCPSTSDCVAVGTGGTVDVTTDAAATWTTEPSFTTTTLTSVSCSSTTQCVAISDRGGIFFTTNGGAKWTTVLYPQTPTFTTARGVDCGSTSACVVVGDGLIAGGGAGGSIIVSSDGGSTWTTAVEPRITTSTYTAVSCTSTAHCVALAATGAVEVSTDGGSSWTSQPALGAARSFTGVSCASAANCFAVGTAAATSPPLVLATTNGGTSWTKQTIPWTVGTLSGVSCPTATNCVAVGGAPPTVVTSTNGGTSWTDEPLTPLYAPGSTGASLTGVSCASASDCVAVGANTVLILTSNGGASWRKATLPSTGLAFDLSGVSCASTLDCVAVGAASNRVTGQASGLSIGTFAVYTTNGGTSWSSAPLHNLTGTAVGSVSCGSTSDCVAVGSAAALVVTTNGGGSWSPVSLPSSNSGDFRSISCASASACVAIGSLQTLVTGVRTLYFDAVTSDGGSSWTFEDPLGPTSSTPPGGSVSCTSTLDCTAAYGVPYYGAPTSSVTAQIWNSTDGGTSWTQDSIPPQTGNLGGVSCTTTTCVAVGGIGSNGSNYSSLGVILADHARVTVYVTDLGGGGGTVTSSTGHISCPSTCSAVFSNGQLLTLTVTPNSTSLVTAVHGCTPSGGTLNPIGGTCSAAGGGAVFVAFTKVTAVLSIVATNVQTGGAEVALAVNGCGSTGAAVYAWVIDGAPQAQSRCSFIETLTVGAHVVALTVTDASRTRQVTTTDNITVSPVAGFAYSIAPVTYGVTTAQVVVNACTRSGGIAGYAWGVGSSTPSPGTCAISLSEPIGTHFTITLVATGTSGTKLTSTSPVYVRPMQKPPSSCVEWSVGPDACWRIGANWLKNQMAFNIGRNPDYAVIAIGGSFDIGSAAATAVVTCDGSVYAGASVAMGPEIDTPVYGALAFGFVGDPNTPTQTNTSIDQFVSGSTASLNVGLGAAGMSEVVSPSAPTPYGVEYDVGAVGVGFSASASYDVLVKAGDGSHTCGPGGVTATKEWQLLTTLAQTNPLGGGGLQINLTSDGGSGGSSPSVGVGVTVNVQSTGWAPGTDVTVVVHSTPVQVAVWPSNATGVSGIEVTIPAGLPLGSHTLIETGTAPGGTTRTVTAPFTVTLNTPTVIPTVTPSNTEQGDSVTYRATVTGAGPPPTGQVTFKVGTTVLCSAVVTASSHLASCSSGTAPAGTDTVIASYSGDSGYSAATATTSLQVAAPPPGPAPTTGCSSTGVGSASFPGGYWLAAANGAVFSCGDAPFYGSLVTLGVVPSKPIVGIAATPDHRGYWLVASDGGLFAFGDAQFYGSMGGRPLNDPVVGMTATPQGGYYEVASDGGMFAFGPDAQFYGSMGGKPLNRPVVGMAETPAGGYYEVASDGGLFAFGPGTPFFGSMGGKALNRPVVGMAVDPAGGYYEVASDGDVFAFGAPFHGSTGCLALSQPIVAMEVSPNITTVGTGTACGFDTPQAPGGYQFVAGDGGVFSFGNAAFAGSIGGQGVTDVVGMANA